MYNNNKSIPQMSAYFGCCDDTIRTKLLELGFKPKIIHNKIVLQLDLQTGKVINQFDSVRAAQAGIGKTTAGGGHISDVCTGKRKSAYGYG